MEIQCKTVIVLGMHRSGTSMVAGVLKKLGVNMGKDTTPDRRNPLGHFENKEFVNLNDQILKKAGGSWMNPPAKEKILQQKNYFLIKIESLIQKQKSGIWGWKDPRTCLTIEFYLPHLINPYFIVCHRDFFGIAKSLKKRDGMDIKDGKKLATIYNCQINEFFKEHPELKKIDLFYEKVINNPEKWLKKIINFLDIHPSKKQRRQALKFMLPKKKMRIKYINYLIKRGIMNPLKAPLFILKRLR